MLIQATITLSKQELLEAITAAVKAKHRFDSSLPSGEALDVEIVAGDYIVEWSEPPADDVPFEAPATKPAEETKTKTEIEF